MDESPIDKGVNEGTAGVRKRFIQAVQRIVEGVLKRSAREIQADFRQFFLPPDISQARIVIVLLAVTVALFAISDYMLLGLTLPFFALVVLRTVLIVYSGWQFKYIRRVGNYQSYDRSIFSYLMALSVGVLLVNLTRPENFLPHIIVIDVAVFVYYVVMPTRFIYQAVPSLLFSIGEVVIIMFTFEEFMAPSLVTALISLVFVNIIAALSSLQLHTYRWRIYENVAGRKETDRLVAIGQTAGMIGHDIRNPLQAIVSELYLAKDGVSSSPQVPKAETLESLNLIEQQTEYISKIVSDLQDFARPIKPEYEEVDLSQLLVSVFQTIDLPEKIILKVDVKGFPKIRTDPTLLRRALTNLVNNAVQAMPEGGNLELTAHKHEDRAVITVADTGKGIPEEIKPKLFTPLVTTKAKGQGLGLAVVKRLVEALGGSIKFESQIDRGTTFQITLPIEKYRA